MGYLPIRGHRRMTVRRHVASEGLPHRSLFVCLRRWQPDSLWSTLVQATLHAWPNGQFFTATNTPFQCAPPFQLHCGPTGPIRPIGAQSV